MPALLTCSLASGGGPATRDLAPVAEAATLDGVKRRARRVTVASKGTASIQVEHDREGRRIIVLHSWLQVLANHSGVPVVIDTWSRNRSLRDDRLRQRSAVWEIRDGGDVPPPLFLEGITGNMALEVLKADAWHIVEQLFPQRAYIVLSRDSSSATPTQGLLPEAIGRRGPIR
jgi:hypothetical protein